MKASIAAILLVYRTASQMAHWDYQHQSEWSNDYEMCGTQDQSPIDIKIAQSVLDPNVCNATFEWEIDFTKQTFVVANNGHSLNLRPVAEEIDAEEWFIGHDGLTYISLDTNTNSIGTLPNYFKPNASVHDTFCLHSIHFHWAMTDDTGSEHLMDGQQFPLEAHFVHFSCAHASLGATLMQFPTIHDIEAAVADGVDTHQMAVVSILFDAVDAINPAFDAMFNNEIMDQITLQDSEHYVLSSIVKDLDLSLMIPDHVSTMGYYAYEGSLTTPPCTNINRWHVMNARGYIGTSQLETFRTLLSAEGQTVAPNYREVQQNVNTVYSCQDPTPKPTLGPTAKPTLAPTSSPTRGPTTEPTLRPSVKPTPGPTVEPTSAPTDTPTEPTSGPSTGPIGEHILVQNTFEVDQTDEPTMKPTRDPIINVFQNGTNKLNCSSIKYFVCIFLAFVNL
eukprot:1040359_1